MHNFIVLITSDLFKFFNKLIDKYKELPIRFIWIDFNNKPTNFKELLKTASCIISRVDLSDAEWNVAKKLKLLQIPIAGYDVINLKRAKKHNVFVCNNGGANAVSVSEHTFLLMLSLCRHFLFHINAVKLGPWQNRKYENSELSGKTLGIIGLGNCGKEVAKRANAFNMNVVYFDILRAPLSFEEKYSLHFNSLKEVLKKSDILTLHVPLTKKTKHMINDKTLLLMKSTAFLINTSRGAVVSEDSLVRALKNNVIKGAALDVFEKEPIPRTSELLKLNNVVLTPHCAPSYETMIKTGKLILDNIKLVYNCIKPNAIVVDYNNLNTKKRINLDVQIDG